MYDLGLAEDLDSHFGAGASGERCPLERKRLVANWKTRVVEPCVRRHEARWFSEQVAMLNTEGLVPYAELVPLRTLGNDLDIRFAPWGKTMWRFYKAWCVARATSCIPAGVWGRGTRSSGTLCARLERCSLCGACEADLEHVVVSCPLLLGQRESLSALGDGVSSGVSRA